METKVCSKCSEEKSVNCFSPDKRHSDGLYSTCKDCINASNRESRKHWTEEKKEEKRKKKREYEKNHPEKKAQWDKTYRENHAEELAIKKQEYYIANKEYLTEYKKEYARTHKEELAAYKHQYYLDHIDEVKRKAREYYENNRELVNERLVEYRKNNKQAQIAHNLRTRIGNAVSGRSKGGRLLSVIGCDISFFLHHLESLWDENMGWHNYGLGKDKWSMDHIIPLEWHNLENEDECKKAFHFSNTQPMWNPQNASKSNRYSGAYKKS